MRKAKYILRNNTIMMVFHYEGKRIRLSTGIKTESWSKRDQRVNEGSGNIDGIEVNNQLDRIDRDLKKYLREQVERGVRPSFEQVKRKAVVIIRGEYTGDEKTLFGFIKEYIEMRKKLHRTTGTVKAYQTTFNRIQDFVKDSKRYSQLDFFDIDQRFHEQFKAYLMNERKMAHNTIAKHFKNIKIFLNQARKRGYSVTRDYKDFEIKYEKVKKIFLTRAEIEALHNLNLLNQPERYTIARDLFVLACNLGIRFSDYDKIRKDSIFSSEGRKYIDINTQKTNTRVIIPLNWMAIEILERYNYNMPKPFSNQKINEYLKELGNMAGIDETVVITSTKAGIRQDEYFSKYELITTHTARRSLASNLYLTGVPMSQIMNITGHSSEQEFIKYIGSDVIRQLAYDISKNSFFDDNKSSNLKAV